MTDKSDASAFVNSVATCFRKVIKKELSTVELSKIVNTMVYPYLYYLLRKTSNEEFVREYALWVLALSETEIEINSKITKDWRDSVWGRLFFQEKNTLWITLFRQLATFESMEGADSIELIFKESIQERDDLFENLNQIQSYRKELEQTEAIDFLVDYFKAAKQGLEQDHEAQPESEEC